MALAYARPPTTATITAGRHSRYAHRPAAPSPERDSFTGPASGRACRSRRTAPPSDRGQFPRARPARPGPLGWLLDWLLDWLQARAPRLGAVHRQEYLMVDRSVWSARDAPQYLLPRPGGIALGQQASGEQHIGIRLDGRFRDRTLEKRHRGPAQPGPHVLVRQIPVQHEIVRIQVQRDACLALPIAAVAGLEQQARIHIVRAIAVGGITHALREQRRVAAPHRLADGTLGEA